MKKLAIATLIASTFAASAFATEVSVEVVDLSNDSVTLSAEDIALPVTGFDLDISTTQGDEDTLTVGTDYAAPVISGFAPYASVDYTLSDASANSDHVDAEIGSEYALGVMTLDASYGTELSGRDAEFLQASVAYQIDTQLSTEVEYVRDLEADSNATKVKATYDFTPAVYAEVGYTFADESADNFAGAKVGYKF